MNTFGEKIGKFCVLGLVALLGGAACGENDAALEAQISGPVVELAAVVERRRAPTLKIREVLEDQAFLALEDSQHSQLRRAEYTDNIEVPVLSELTYEQIRVALDDTVDIAQLKVEMQPALKRGHWLMYFIDDQPAGAAIPVKDASFELPKLALGEHLLRVDVLDETLMVLQSSRPHIIYVEDALQQPLAAN